STGAPDGLHGSVRRPTAAARGGFTLLAACLAACLVVTPAPGEESPVSRPPQLERDVEFWIRVYTQIDTDAGFLHDQYNLPAVDDRLDPFRSTEAAAQLLAYNYRVLGTWPLALTAYNHGTAGVRRAKETLGTDDIVRIVRSYNSRTFGFASRNFYVSFLAALEVDRNPEKYFGSLQRQSAVKFQEVQLPAYV